MDRLSGLDASFLYLETPAQLMHVCGLIVLDPSTMPDGVLVRRDSARASGPGSATSTTSPASCAGCRWGSTTRSGCDDRQFDIERHVHRLALPTPGGYAELTELASHLAGLPLDRSRPLWEMWVIEGYTGEDGRDLIAVFTKMHHATVDGVSGANLISHLCSLEPDAEPLDGSQPQTWPREPGPAELLGRAMLTSATRPFQTFGLLAPTVKGVGRHHRPGPRRARRWPRRSPRRARRSTAPSPATGRSRSRRWTSG